MVAASSTSLPPGHTRLVPPLPTSRSLPHWGPRGRRRCTTTTDPSPHHLEPPCTSCGSISGGLRDMARRIHTGHAVSGDSLAKGCVAPARGTSAQIQPVFSSPRHARRAPTTTGTADGCLAVQVPPRQNLSTHTQPDTYTAARTGINLASSQPHAIFGTAGQQAAPRRGYRCLRNQPSPCAALGQPSAAVRTPQLSALSRGSVSTRHGRC